MDAEARRGAGGLCREFRRMKNFREGCKEDGSKELGGYLVTDSQDKSRHTASPRSSEQAQVVHGWWLV